MRNERGEDGRARSHFPRDVVRTSRVLLPPISGGGREGGLSIRARLEKRSRSALPYESSRFPADSRIAASKSPGAAASARNFGFHILRFRE